MQALKMGVKRAGPIWHHVVGKKYSNSPVLYAEQIPRYLSTLSQLKRIWCKEEVQTLCTPDEQGSFVTPKSSSRILRLFQMASSCEAMWAHSGLRSCCCPQVLFTGAKPHQLPLFLLTCLPGWEWHPQCLVACHDSVCGGTTRCPLEPYFAEKGLWTSTAMVSLKSFAVWYVAESSPKPGVSKVLPSRSSWTTMPRSLCHHS